MRADGAADPIHVFVGPPSSEEWDRVTLWIRGASGEREIKLLDGESGRAYVLRVWQETRSALGR